MDSSPYSYFPAYLNARMNFPLLGAEDFFIPINICELCSGTQVHGLETV